MIDRRFTDHSVSGIPALDPPSTGSPFTPHPPPHRSPGYHTLHSTLLLIPFKLRFSLLSSRLTTFMLHACTHARTRACARARAHTHTHTKQNNNKNLVWLFTAGWGHTNSTGNCLCWGMKLIHNRQLKCDTSQPGTAFYLECCLLYTYWT